MPRRKFRRGLTYSFLLRRSAKESFGGGDAKGMDAEMSDAAGAAGGAADFPSETVQRFTNMGFSEEQVRSFLRACTIIDMLFLFFERASAIVIVTSCAFFWSRFSPLVLHFRHFASKQCSDHAVKFLPCTGRNCSAAIWWRS